MMIFCEGEFEQPDPRDPDHSMCEVDFYAWIPYEKQHGTEGVPNHRLSIRKNLKRGEYEVYRRYYHPVQFTARMEGLPVHVLAGEDTGREQVVFRSKDLQEALDFAVGEWNRFHGTEEHQHERDLVCEHRHPRRSWLCKIHPGR